uniref:Uncharacterized protein n=1 Tax=Ditylenchus dipsaci TaxID=166011 RepID=A0A915EA47_9BILA
MEYQAVKCVAMVCLVIICTSLFVKYFNQASKDRCSNGDEGLIHELVKHDDVFIAARGALEDMGTTSTCPTLLVNP